MGIQVRKMFSYIATSKFELKGIIQITSNLQLVSIVNFNSIWLNYLKVCAKGINESIDKVKQTCYWNHF